MNRIFGAQGAGGDSKPDGSSQFTDTQGGASQDKAPSRSAPHRDLVKVVLRETMRKHGIPSDWIDSRSLSVFTRQRKPGMHVHFLVRKADEQLLPYVHAFQESFWEAILELDPAARDWLFSVTWEFSGKSVRGFSGMPGLDIKDQAAEPPAGAGDTAPAELADDVATDLQALQALMSASTDLTGLPDSAPHKREP